MRAVFSLAPSAWVLASVGALVGCGARTPLLAETAGVEGGDSGVRTPDAGVPLRDSGVDAGDARANRHDSGPACAARARVFVTSLMYDGNLGGLRGADANCAARAAAGGLRGEFRAWLSDGATGAYAHIQPFAGGYALLDGTVVASAPATLQSGSLDHAIDTNEDGDVIADGNTEVWTGTATDGTGAGAYCTDSAGEDWSSGDMNALTPLVGLLTTTDYRWTAVYAQFCNRTNVRLYCFEVCP
jgi:hypothetical protein